MSCICVTIACARHKRARMQRKRHHQAAPAIVWSAERRVVVDAKTRVNRALLRLACEYGCELLMDVDLVLMLLMLPMQLTQLLFVLFEQLIKSVNLQINSPAAAPAAAAWRFHRTCCNTRL